MRKTHSEQFKFKIALLAMKGDMTIAEICHEHEIAPSLVHKWKKQLLSQGAELFSKSSNKKKVENSAQEKKTKKLYEKIGQLTVERDFLKKSWEGLNEKDD